MSFQGFVTHRDLFVALRNHKNLLDSCYLFNTILLNNNVQLSESAKEKLKNWCKRFCYRIHIRWNKSHRYIDQFTKTNSEWLNTSIKWPDFTEDTSKSEEHGDTSTAEIPEDLEPIHSLITTLNAAGKHDEANILKYLVVNPEKVPRILNMLKNRHSSSVHEVSPQKALDLCVVARFSKWQYIGLRDMHLEEGLIKYPSYSEVLKEKNKRYPNKEDAAKILKSDSESDDDDCNNDSDIDEEDEINKD